MLQCNNRFPVIGRRRDCADDGRAADARRQHRAERVGRDSADRDERRLRPGEAHVARKPREALRRRGNRLRRGREHRAEREIARLELQRDEHFVIPVARQAEPRARPRDRAEIGGLQILLAEVHAVCARVEREPPVIVDEHARVRMAAARGNGPLDLRAQRVGRGVLHAQLHGPHAAIEHALDPFGARQHRIQAEPLRARRKRRFGRGGQAEHARKACRIDGPRIAAARLVAVAPCEREHERVGRGEAAIEKRRERRDPVVGERRARRERMARRARVERGRCIVDDDRPRARRVQPRDVRGVRAGVARDGDPQVGRARLLRRRETDPRAHGRPRPRTERRANPLGGLGKLVGGRPERVGQRGAHAWLPSWCQNGMPTTGVLACALSRASIGPARYAARPASTPRANARAMISGCVACDTAVFSNTPSKPHSITWHACDGTPSPASTMSGTSGSRSRSTRSPYGFTMPLPVPIGAPHGISASQPASSRRRAITRSSVQYGSTLKPSFTSSVAASIKPTGSGCNV
ncbi:hypothetical protein BURPS1710b_3706 [Burkholderia pseudomallei 1710b]|uniref:Uncharacterized protein n=1 Tax=Burkholderia pseudomallei (strain 1710b) TaxID=320372 RepID=Q3JMY3_BURP1|nr:hypothetical protein BURPS1710b_3706 [Burkholderia pseudomallei 1710b]